jgi:7-cyano-7-deazaguanine synthase in queuosine biosynthesis
MAKELAIVLNSGSVNSAVVTALAAQKHRPIMLYAETSTATGARSRAAYDQQVGHFKPYREHLLSMPFLATVSPSSQNQSQIVSDPRQHSAIGARLLELLPMIAIAARFAVHYQAAGIYLGLRIGPQADELAQASEFLQITNELLQLPCGQSEMEIVTPLLELEPWQVVDLGFHANAPFDKTWSCLEEMSEPCWACRGCRVRESAFQQAAKPDPMHAVRKI